jgi:hypothetical protein
VQEKIGTELAITDVVEAVFLNAFAGYDRRPTGGRFGQWLETLIDGPLKGLLQNLDEVLESVSFARTQRDLAREQRAVPLKATRTDEGRQRQLDDGRRAEVRDRDKAAAVIKRPAIKRPRGFDGELVRGLIRACT